MNRLFEALSCMELDQPTPNGVPPELAAQDVIQLGVRAAAVALTMSAQEAVTEELLSETVSLDVPPSDVALTVSAQEAVTEELSSEAAILYVPLSDVPLNISAHEAVTVELSSEATVLDVPLSDMALNISAQEAVAEELSSETAVLYVPLSDVAQTISAHVAATEEHSSEAAALYVPPSDVALNISARETVTEDLSSEAVSLDVPPSDAALTVSAQQAVTKELSSETVSLDVPPSDAAPIMSAPEAATEQVSPEGVAPDASLSSVTLSDGPDVNTASFWPTTHMLVAKDSQTQSAKSTAARRIRIRPPVESRLVALTNPDSLGAEKFRALVTRLERLHKQCDLKCFQVTSSVINEGKTLVSGNVAVTLAKHSGAKTLLIEGDLHRPTLGTTFGLNNMRGLSHWWSGPDQELGQFVHKVDDLPLWFLSAGKPCDRPSDILRSARFVNAFAQLASQFEWIVVDSTPMLPIVDVNLWSRIVDGTLLVVREGVTPVKALKEGLRSLDHPNLIGVVLNEASATDATKYDGQYYGSQKHK